MVTRRNQTPSSNDRLFTRNIEKSDRAYHVETSSIFHSSQPPGGDSVNQDAALHVHECQLIP